MSHKKKQYRVVETKFIMFYSQCVILNVPADMNNVDIVLGVHKCHHINKMLSYSVT